MEYIRDVDSGFDEGDNIFDKARQMLEAIKPTGWCVPIDETVHTPGSSTRRSSESELELSEEESLEAAWKQHQLGIEEMLHDRELPSEFMDRDLVVLNIRRSGSNPDIPYHGPVNCEDFEKESIGLLVAGECGLRGSAAGSLLADESGLGQRFHTLVLIKKNPANGPTLIVTTRDRIHLWQADVDQCLGMGLRYAILGPTTELESKDKGKEDMKRGGKERNDVNIQNKSHAETSVDGSDMIHEALESGMTDHDTELCDKKEHILPIGCAEGLDGKNDVSNGARILGRTIREYDIVFATYERVGAQFSAMTMFMDDMNHRRLYPYPHRKSRNTPKFGFRRDLCFRRPRASLFQVDWGRVVLDQSETINEPDTVIARGCFYLRAKYRLSISANPLNGFLEIYSRLKFLRVRPYNQWSWFGRHFFLANLHRRHPDSNFWSPMLRHEVATRLAILFIATVPETLRRRRSDTFNGHQLLPSARPIRCQHIIKLRADDYFANIWAYKGVSLVDAMKGGYSQDADILKTVEEFFHCLQRHGGFSSFEVKQYYDDAEGFWPRNEVELQYFTRVIWCAEYGAAIARTLGSPSRMPTLERIEDAILSIVHPAIPPLRWGEPHSISQNLSRERDFLNWIKGNGRWRSTKIEKCIDILRRGKIVAETEKWIVIAYVSKALDIMQAGLEYSRDIPFTRIDLGMTPKAFDDCLRQFESEEERAPFVLLLDSNVEFTTLSFCAASNVLLLTPEWNLAHEDYLDLLLSCFGPGNAIRVHQIIADQSIDRAIEEKQQARGEKQIGMLDLFRNFRARIEIEDPELWMQVESIGETMRSWDRETFVYRVSSSLKSSRWLAYVELTPLVSVAKFKRYILKESSI
jgi:SNF2-related domain